MTSRPDLREHYLGPGRVESFAYVEGGVCAMAVQPDLSHAGKRAREIQMWGFWARPPVGGKHLGVRPRNLSEIDGVSVDAQGRFVESMEPEWVERVKLEWEFYGDEESVVFWSGLPPESVRAILIILRDRGEIAGRSAN